MSAFSPSQCRGCHWALEGLKRKPDPTPEEMADNDAFFDRPPRAHRLIDDSRGRAARALMDKVTLLLQPPITAESLTFWEDYAEQLGHLFLRSPKALKVLREFYPFGPRYDS
jgi:hypothetical protein